jgi:predicted O-linked N-acetylglucosamine transferase (SPINDLY family)
MASLYSASVLGRLGKKQWIAPNLQQYAQVAIDLAQDIPQLQRVRRQLRGQVAETYCQSSESTTINIETALQNVWHNYCDRVATESLTDPGIT